jgi:Bacterial protein of unknown function (DUF948)
MSAGQVAALIAAAFFAVGMGAAVFVLLKLGRLISQATRMLSDYRDSADKLIDRAQAAVDRTNEQLARTDSITANMDEVTANMADLSGHVSALAGLARGISAGLGAPLLRVSAFAYGIRRAVGLRRPARVTSATREPGALASQRDGVRRALPRQRTEASLNRREEVRR